MITRLKVIGNLLIAACGGFVQGYVWICALVVWKFWAVAKFVRHGEIEDLVVELPINYGNQRSTNLTFAISNLIGILFFIFSVVVLLF